MYHMVVDITYTYYIHVCGRYCVSHYMASGVCKWLCVCMYHIYYTVSVLHSVCTSMAMRVYVSHLVHVVDITYTYYIHVYVYVHSL